MKIHSMTATFGKLEHETLVLEPGLNVITGSNEWGKSTWCAFLAAMLYGLDTRLRTTRSALSEKERYTPWSGSPMSGRIDLSWKGRNITIQRTTTGRVPLGEFRAYETETGVSIPELTAENCGEQLLGVERSVFTRTGFIRFRDLSVTDDEALRRRLNNLVTAGDENSAADRMQSSIRELKNRIRYNRTGLLPQAEAQRQQLEEKLRELEELEDQLDKAQRRLDEVEDWRMALENHRAALAYADALEDGRKVARAEQAREAARRRFEELSALCQTLPERDAARELLEEIDRLEEKLRDIQGRLLALPPEQPGPELPEQFQDLTGREARDWAQTDAERYEALRKKKSYGAIFGIVLALAGAAILRTYPTPGLVCCGVALAVLVWDLAQRRLRRRELRGLEAFYGSDDPEQWLELAEQYAKALEQRERTPKADPAQRRELEQQLQALNNSILEATRGQGLELCRRDWEGVLSSWEAFDEAAVEYHRSREHLDALRSMARSAPPPDYPDRMDYSWADTARLLSDCAAERRRLENLRGQYQGRMDALGAKSELSVELARIQTRISQLEKSWSALTIAQETLSEASAQLQRRFAPRIARRTEALMRRMTGGRYDRLNLDEDLTLRAAAEREDTLRGILCRSDGTVDQLYLALRLAVSAELMPEAPLVLDDALVRFDDGRLKAALDILKEESGRRQVILFSCHSRERNML